ncbi:hypothetical protein CCAX7_13930 [Capsulimonas corticalis]|uniref:Uncharacterized protein n=1 Tax=Capsulimonas corticalis TaxID=2219043 RepID=A0A402D6R6_9BACT|nr:hypothetical protein CCAX7_13930 [Capsulimonas corticalis]
MVNEVNAGGMRNILELEAIALHRLAIRHFPRRLSSLSVQYSSDRKKGGEEGGDNNVANAF